MAFAQSADRRPIEGAVATLGVSDRVAFLRRTYAHLGGALIAWAALTAILFRVYPQIGYKLATQASGRASWLLVIGAFFLLQMAAQALARSHASRGLQYVGLLLGVVGEAVILQPLIFILFWQFNHGEFGSTSPMTIVGEAALISGVIFAGLTLTVFITKKDFTFLRGALMIASFAALGIIIGSAIFGFHLGVIFCGAMVLLMAGYVLMQTSLVMQYYPPQEHVAASLMLFSTVATLFWYILQLVMELNRR